MTAGSNGIAATLEQAVSLHKRGRLAGAEQLYRSVLDVSPDHADANHLLGVVEMDSGHPDRGRVLIERALEHDPENVVYLNNLGICLRRLRRYDESLDYLERALALEPDYVEALNSRACVLADLGRFAEAADAFRSMLEFRPDDAQTMENLSKALIRTGQLEDAETVLRDLLEIHPDSANALSLLGSVFRERNDAAAAFNMHWRAIQADPENTSLWVTFASTFSQLEFSEVQDEKRLSDILLASLLKEGIDHQSLAKVVRQILLRDASIRRLIELAREDETSLFRDLDRSETVAVLSERSFLTVLQRVILPDVDLERFLTKLRRYLLGVSVRADIDDRWCVQNPNLICALARQCFMNGYVFEETPEDVSLFDRLISEMASEPLEANSRDRFRIAVVACYVRLADWDRSAEILESTRADAEQDYLTLLTQQIEEPLLELELRDQIPVFGETFGDISTKVRAQYEEHPYPRWTSVNTLQPKTVPDVMRDLFPGFDVARLRTTEPPKVLVAGCGTGKQLLLTRSRFKDAQIVGMDLSMTSLAYALRRMRDFGVDDIALMQGDILSLDAWSEPLDIIECVGVLHHMEDPVAGWRILTKLLKPGGIMRIGLYSARAREEIVKVRDFIAERGYDATEDDIRRGRQTIIEQLRGSAGEHLLSSVDFHSLHGARDLLFHAHEGRFTLPQIAGVISDLGLEFLGFEFANWCTLAAFKKRFSNADALQSLDAWHQFEADNPHVFAGMYQFWLLKPAVT